MGEVCPLKTHHCHEVVFTLSVPVTYLLKSHILLSPQGKMEDEWMEEGSNRYA